MNDLIDQTGASTTRRKRVAFLTDQENGEAVEQSEPWHVLEQAGAEPVSLPLQRTADASVDEYDALVVPGDEAQPDDATRDFVRQFGESGKPVGALREPGWLQQCIPAESLVTGERPDDVPGFNNALLESLAHGDAGTS